MGVSITAFSSRLIQEEVPRIYALLLAPVRLDKESSDLAFDEKWRRWMD